MKIPDELTAILGKMVNDEVERRIKGYHVYVRIDGELVDSCSVIEGGQININIETPIFFPGADRECVLIHKNNVFSKQKKRRHHESNISV